jgi:hypothetical protein
MDGFQDLIFSLSADPLSIFCMILSAYWTAAETIEWFVLPVSAKNSSLSNH